MSKRFRIALSFAGEKREYVAKVAELLARRFGKEKILYDKFHEAEFATYNLGILLPKLYSEQSDLIVPVLCPTYDAKCWTGWEWAHIYGLLTKTDGRLVMPSRFEHANADGLAPAAGFIELDDKMPEQFAELILERLALNEGKPKNHYSLSVSAEKRTIGILYAQWDHRLAEELKNLIAGSFGVTELRMMLPSQCRGVPRRDFLIALFSPHALVDPEFRFILGREVGRRDPSLEEMVDAVLYGAGCQREDVKELEGFYDIFKLDQGGITRFLAKLKVWLSTNGLEQKASISESPLNPLRVSEFINAYKGHFDKQLNAATKILHNYSQHLPDLDQTHHPATHYIYATADDLSKRVVRIVNARDIYKRDTDALRQLGPDDYYYATHPVLQNSEARPGVARGSSVVISPEVTATYAEYQNYVVAQKEAARRGVKVERIYIVPSMADLHSAMRAELRIEMEGLDKAGVCVYVVEEQPGLYSAEFQRDFVLISGKCLGRGYPENAQMAWSDYLIGGTPSGDRTIEAYESHFRSLRDNPKTQRYYPTESSFAPSLLARTPAAVELTGTRIDLSPGDRLMVVLRTNGCAYDKNNLGCTMCDFKRHSIPGSIQKLQSRDLLAQLESTINRPEAASISHVDMLVLGSFLDSAEIPEAFWRDSLALLERHPTLKRILIESRTQYIREETLLKLKRYLVPHQRMEVGIGVESSNDFLRNNVLNKSLKWSELERAVNLLARHEFGFVAYILIKPQTLSEADALQDAVASAERVAEVAQAAGFKPGEWRLAFEPVFITKGTILEEFWRNNIYELVNLWTVVEVVKRTRHLTDVFVGLSDEGLSDGRRPKGCDHCTASVTEALQRFNRTNEAQEFEQIQCDNCLNNLPWLKSK